MFSQSGPQRYISDVDAYDQLPSFISDLKVTKVLFLHGTKSLRAAKPYLPNFGDHVEVTDVFFNGECSYEEIHRVAAIAKEHQVQMVIGLGGGKVLDTAKAVTTGTHLYLVLIPTLASNCAPWSSVSVHYKANGEHLDHKIYKETAHLLLINPKVILNSPVNYYVAGIADTLAKFYESELMFEALDDDEYMTALSISRQMAINCKNILLNNSVQAVKDMQAGQLTHTWRTVMETIIVTAGTVGGWGGDYARSTGAHSVHDALTLFPETVHLLHGIKVGYGILVQLAIEHHYDDIRNLLPFYHELNIPTNLEDLGLGDIDAAGITKIAAVSADPETTMHLIPLDIDTDTVKNAIYKLEEITAPVK